MKNLKICPNFIVKLLFLSGTLALSSCTTAADLAKVREYSTLSNQAKEGLPVIAGDFYRSCLRRAQYVLVSPLPSDDAQSTIPIPSDLG